MIIQRITRCFNHPTGKSHSSQIVIIFVGVNDGRAGTLGTARANVLIRRGTSPVPRFLTGSSCGTAAALHRDVSRWAAGGLFEEPCGTIRCEALLLAGCTPGHVSLPRSGHSIAGIDHRTVARCRDLRFGDLGRTAQQRPGACTGKSGELSVEISEGETRDEWRRLYRDSDYSDIDD